MPSAASLQRASGSLKMSGWSCLRCPTAIHDLWPWLRRASNRAMAIFSAPPPSSAALTDSTFNFCVDVAMIALECCLANAIAQRAQRSVENRVSTQPGGGSIPRNVTIAGRLNENSRHHIPRGAEQPLYVIDFAQFDQQTLCGDISPHRSD